MNWRFILAIIILVVLTTILCIIAQRKSLVDNFDKIRCDPLYMPFVSLIKPDVNATENYHYCTQLSSQKAMPNYFKDFMGHIDLRQKASDLLKMGEQDISLGLKFIGARLTSFFGKLFTGFTAMENAVNIVSNKIGTIMKKIGAIVVLIFYFTMNFFNACKLMVILPTWAFLGMWVAVASTTLTAGIAWVSAWAAVFPPVVIALVAVAVALTIVMAITLTLTLFTQTQYNVAESKSYCCFARTTDVVCKNDEIKKMNDIEIGQELDNKGNHVLGKLITINSSKMVDYDGICVCNDHFVYESSSWVHAGKNKKECKPENVVVCLVTTKNQFVCKSNKSGKKYIFCDYEESKESSLVISEIILKSLNCSIKPNIKYENGEADNVLSPTAKIYMQDGTIKNIQDIEINDVCLHNNTVLGIYESKTEPVWFDVNGVPMNARQIFWNGDSWFKIYHKYDVIQRLDNENTVYRHIITSSGIIPLYHPKVKIMYIRDFIETHDQNTNKEIDNLIHEFLKKKT
tara:strand:+ start:8223 stop:9767 length:1545 start_codon:yes stop_codon:yes gene_type:complete